MSLNSRRRRSKYLTGTATDNLREATAFAAERGTPINCAISINSSLFSGFGVPDEVRLARAQERLRHRLGRRDLETRVVVGARTGRPHGEGLSQEEPLHERKS